MGIWREAHDGGFASWRRPAAEICMLPLRNVWPRFPSGGPPLPQRESCRAHGNPHPVLTTLSLPSRAPWARRVPQGRDGSKGMRVCLFSQAAPGWGPADRSPLSLEGGGLFQHQGLSWGPCNRIIPGPRGRPGNYQWVAQRSSGQQASPGCSWELFSQLVDHARLLSQCLELEWSQGTQFPSPQFSHGRQGPRSPCVQPACFQWGFSDSLLPPPEWNTPPTPGGVISVQAGPPDPG